VWVGGTLVLDQLNPDHRQDSRVFVSDAG
jgi:hypothetical protein